MNGKVVVVDHPLLKHKLAVVRDKRTGNNEFRNLLNEIGTFLAYEAIRDIPTTKVNLITPLSCSTEQVIGDSLLIVGLFRSALVMLQGIASTMPFADVGHIGIYRERRFDNTVEYFFKLPKETNPNRVLLIDPLIGTGSTACAAIDRLKFHGHSNIAIINLLASRKGVERIFSHHDDIHLYTLSPNENLNKDGFLVPGLGDISDRMFKKTEPAFSQE